MQFDKITLPSGGILESYVLDNPKDLSVSKRVGILIFPGGGYFFISNKATEPLAFAFLGQGYNAFVLRYRINQGADTSIQDGKEALEYILLHKEDYALNKVVICGESAGAHIAIANAVFNEKKPDGLILIYPPLTVFNGSRDVYAGINKDTPKSFIVHSVSDATVPISDSIRLIQRLNEVGVEFEAHFYRSGDHGFSLATMPVSCGNKEFEHSPNASWFPLAIRWIKDSIGDLEFYEKIQRSDLPHNLYVPFKRFLDRPECIEIINRYYPDLIKENNHERFYRTELGNMILYTQSTTLERIRLMAKELEKYIPE